MTVFPKLQKTTRGPVPEVQRITIPSRTVLEEQLGRAGLAEGRKGLRSSGRQMWGDKWGVGGKSFNKTVEPGLKPEIGGCWGQAQMALILSLRGSRLHLHKAPLGVLKA